jgi:hypothetical protein
LEDLRDHFQTSSSPDLNLNILPQQSTDLSRLHFDYNDLH